MDAGACLAPPLQFLTYQQTGVTPVAAVATHSTVGSCTVHHLHTAGLARRGRGGSERVRPKGAALALRTRPVHSLERARQGTEGGTGAADRDPAGGS